MGSSAGGPPPTQERPDWLPNLGPVAVTEAPPPSVDAPAPFAPPTVWQAPPSPSRLPLIAGVAVIALVLTGGGYWFMRDSAPFQQQPAASTVVAQPTPHESQYDRADKVVNRVLAPDLVLIQAKLNQGAGACSGYTAACRAALENVEPAIANAVADLDSADVPLCIRTELQTVRTDLSNMDKATLGSIAMMKSGQDDYGRTMAASIGQIQSQLVVKDMPPLTLAFQACPKA